MLPTGDPLGYTSCLSWEVLATALQSTPNYGLQADFLTIKCSRYELGVVDDARAISIHLIHDLRQIIRKFFEV